MKRTIDKNIVAVLFCLLTFFNVESKDILTSDSLSKRLMYQTWSYPQEKVYLSTDKAAYVSGDTIRFRVFLVDAATHMRPNLESKYVYVELIDPFGKNRDRIKVLKKDGVYAGILPIDSEIPEGNYTLCAYTQFMKNSGKDYYFRKSIPVFNQLSSKYRLDVQTDKGKLKARLYEKGSNRPVRVENISILGPEGEFFAARIRKRSDYSMSITNAMKRAGHVIVKFDKYEKFVAMPMDTTKISVSFHPEGGYLIPDVKNRMAFKAINNNGLSEEINGVVVDDTGKSVVSLRSVHKGMGEVEFIPESDRLYRAVINNISFNLPKAEKMASVLSVAPIGSDSLLINIKGCNRENISLLAHNGGVVTLAMEAKDHMRIERKRLGSGIVQLLLADEKGDILSSRMIFNHNGYLYNPPIDELPNGDYVVKASISAISDTTSSLVSNLLLQSELRGYIEDPDYYFRCIDSISASHLDLLMLTQGWERYNLDSALHNEFTEPEIPLEIGGEISGVVKSRWKGKPLENAVVMLISPQLDYADQILTDSEGRFVFNGLEWPDGTVFIIQVFGDSGDKEHNYLVDKDESEGVNPILAFQDVLSTDEAVDYDLLTAGTVMLDELVVTAPMSLEESRREMLTALGVRSFTADEMEAQHITSYEQLIRKIPGIKISNGNVVSSFARASLFNTGMTGAPVQYWVDGTQWHPTISSSGSLASSNSPQPISPSLRSEDSYKETMQNTLSEFEGMYPFHIVETIEYYRPSTAMVISMSAAHGGGALVVTTKDGSKIKDWDADLFMRSFKPLGYQDEPEAYEPHYIYDPTTDEGRYRAAWLPKVTDTVSVPDKDEFYLEIEGLADGYIPVLVRSKPKE